MKKTTKIINRLRNFLLENVHEHLHPLVSNCNFSYSMSLKNTKTTSCVHKSKREGDLNVTDVGREGGPRKAHLCREGAVRESRGWLETGGKRRSKLYDVR